MLILTAGMAGSFFTSCSNIFENDVTEENEVQSAEEPEPVSISAQMIFNGAVPQEILQNGSSTGATGIEPSRAAIPTFTSSEIDYFAVATTGTGANLRTSYGTFGAAGSANEGSFTILLIPGKTWTITCGIKIKNSTAESDRILTAVMPSVVPENIASGSTLNFYPVPDTSDTTAAGQIDLTMTIDSSIKSIELTANGSNAGNWPFTNATIAAGGTTATIRTDSSTPAIASVPAGTYNVLMSFYDENDVLLYTTVQNISVCKGLTTRAWISSGGQSPIDSSGNFNVSAAKIQTYASTNFYVGVTGATNALSPSNNNSGSHKAPFLTFDKALSVIQGLATAAGADTTREYTIHICGTVNNTSTTTVPEIGSTLNGKLAKLTIQGRANTSNPPVLQNPNSSGRVLNIATTVPVEISGLTITSGNADGSSGPDAYGGGLYLSGTGTSVTLNNTIIEENQAKLQGGGVYLASGASLTMTGSSSAIKDNALTAPYTGPVADPDSKICGGGLFIAQGGSFQMNNGTVSGNAAADAGGGLFIRGNFTLNNGTITSNKRTASGSAQVGANIEMGIPGHFIMNGGTITSTLVQGWQGAAVNIFLTSHDPTGTATIDLNGGSITGINSRSGAVKMSGYSSNRNVVFNMTGGSITANHAKGSSSDGFGGAVYVDSYSVFNMTGGEISGNSAEQQGGGVYCTGSGSVTLGTSAATSTVKIRNNTAGTSTSANASNLCLQNNQRITVAGALSTESEIGITRTYSSSPFTTGYASTNSGTAPNQIFTSDQDFDIVASTQTGFVGEATQHMDVTGGAIYLPGDYNFTLTTLQDSIKVGEAATVRVGLSVSRTEPGTGSTPTTLYYNATNQKLYTDQTFTTPAGGTNEVSWAATLLWNGTHTTLTAGSGVNANLFTIPALSFEDSYTLHVTATYMGYTHDASFTIICEEDGVVPEGMVYVAGTTFDGSAAVTGSKIFLSGRNIGQIRNLIACDHEVTQGEYEKYMRYYNSSYTPNETYGVGKNYPVYYMNWYEAVIYCNLRSLEEGLTPAYYLADSSGAEIGGPGNGRNVDTWLNSVVSGTSIYKDATTNKYYYGKTNAISNKLDWIDVGSGDSTGGIRFDTEANGWRLPTEIEWEYLARSGNLTGTQTTYSGTAETGNDINKVAWYKTNSGSKAHEVKTDKTSGVDSANGLGLYDMTGNVGELCCDWYASDSAISTTPVTGAASSNYNYRTCKGGSINSYSSSCALNNSRSEKVTYSRSIGVGFRVVRNAD